MTCDSNPLKPSDQLSIEQSRFNMIREQKFSFGENWQRFLESLDQDRIKIAAQSLIEFLDIPDLHGKSFIDIGCGSGLFSYAAFQLGAERIVSFDVDPFSVQCCKHLHNLADSPAKWEIFEGSVLEKPFISSLGNFDIVYSWGGTAPHRKDVGIHIEFVWTRGAQWLLLHSLIQQNHFEKRISGVDPQVLAIRQENV